MPKAAYITVQELAPVVHEDVARDSKPQDPFAECKERRVRAGRICHMPARENLAARVDESRKVQTMVRFAVFGLCDHVESVVIRNPVVIGREIVI